MTDHWRGDSSTQTAMGKFWRGRYEKGSLWVLDIDHIVMKPDLSDAIWFEEKLADAHDKTWTATRTFAHRLRHTAGLIEYTTDDAGPFGNVTDLTVTIAPPGATPFRLPGLRPDQLDSWIVQRLGGQKRRAA